MADPDDTEQRIYLQPLVRLTKNPEGTWHVNFDFADSFIDAEGGEQWSDSTEEACNAFDQWVESQPVLKDGTDIPGYYIPEEPL